jgi:hypothetical protein
VKECSHDLKNIPHEIKICDITKSKPLDLNASLHQPTTGLTHNKDFVKPSYLPPSENLPLILKQRCIF